MDVPYRTEKPSFIRAVLDHINVHSERCHGCLALAEATFVLGRLDFLGRKNKNRQNQKPKELLMLRNLPQGARVRGSGGALVVALVDGRRVACHVHANLHNPSPKDTYLCHDIADLSFYADRTRNLRIQGGLR